VRSDRALTLWPWSCFFGSFARERSEHQAEIDVRGAAARHEVVGASIGSLMIGTET